MIERTAQVISDSADCAIGYEAANMVLKGIRGFRDDYVSHVKTGRCLCNPDQPVPCVAQCPAGVDIPGATSPWWARGGMPTLCGSSGRTIPSPESAAWCVSTPVSPGAAGT